MGGASDQMSYIKIYVVHYTPLIERKKNIIQQLKKNNLKAEFISDFDKENLTDIDLSIFDIDRVKLGVCSNICKHICCYRKIIQNNVDYALVLEDDACLCQNFSNKLKTYLSQLPSNFDMLFIGDGCGLHILQSELKPGKYIYEKGVCRTSWGGAGATRCTDSYIISSNCATKIIDYINKKNEIIGESGDHWLNRVIRSLDLTVYWAEPTIVQQGSQNGVFNSSIQ